MEKDKGVIRVAVFASGSGTNAENIIRYFQSRGSGVEVALVVCNRKGAQVFGRAERLGVPAEYVPKPEFADSGRVLSLLAGYRIDFIVLAGFLLVVPEFLIERYRGRIVNIHPSLLPAYGGKGMYGMHVHEAVVAAGERETGITIHHVSEHCDEGEIIFQTRVTLESGDTPESVAAKVHALEYEHYPRVIETLLRPAAGAPDGCVPADEGRGRLRICVNMIWLALFFIMAGIFLISAPKYADDIWYLNKISQWLIRHGVLFLDDACFPIFGEFPWQEVRDTLAWRYYNDNIRLANVLGVFFLLLPKWIGSGVALTALIYSVFKIFNIVAVRWRSSSLVLVAIVVLSLVVPWSNSLGSIIYQFNYLLPTAIGLWLVGIIFKREKRASVLLAFSGGLLLGLWHEGFGVPVMAGLVVMAFFRRHLRRKDLYGAVTGIAIGTMILFTSPGMLNRGSGALDSMFSHHVNLFNLFSSFSIFAISTVIYAYLLFAGRNRKTKSDDIACMCVVSGIVSFLIQLSTDINCGRIGWWCHVMTLPVLLYVLDVTSHDFWKRYTWKNICLLILPVSLSFLYWGTVDYLAVRMSNSYRHIESECYNGKREVFADVMQLSKLPLPAINTNMYDLYDISHFIGDYYTKEDTVYISIVSKDLEHVTSLSGREVPGGSGVRDYNGNLYVEYSDSVRYGWEEYLQCDFGTGYVRTPFLCNSFISKADGCRYVELRPRVNVYKARHRKIEGIKPGMELP